VNYLPSRETSAAITLVRPLLIFFMMLAHLFALNNVAVMNGDLPLTLDNWLTVFLKSILSKSGVPLLSLISGYLAVYSLRKYGYFRLLLKKARRLLWPLVWANLLFILLITWPAQAANPAERPDLAIHPFNFYGWFQATFAFYKLPANQPLFFLKDLFTCFLLLPLLLALARIRYLNFLVLAWWAYKCIYLQSVFILPIYPTWFFRFDIVFAFYCGILLFLHGKPLVIANRALNFALVGGFAAVCCAVGAVYVLLPGPDHNTLFLWLDFTVKVVSVFGSVALMSLLHARQGAFSRLLRYLSPYAYSLFLTHAFSFHFYHRLFLRFFGGPEFFGWSGILYIVGIFAVATVLAVVMRIAWEWLFSRVSSKA
jgi:succinoglycan biosynthesis protein ExoH